MRETKRERETAARQKRGGSKYFVAVPDEVLRSHNAATLSAHAVKLLWDLLAQYNRKNNGDLSMAWTLMKRRGWKSPDTLSKARLELLDRSWVTVTRQGGRRTPTLYGLTFYAIDHCNGKLDVQGTEKPYGLWRGDEPMPPLKIVKTPKSKEILDAWAEQGERFPKYAGRTNKPAINTPGVLRPSK